MNRIVCDFDDTLSFTTNRDWENAEPNIPLINKLNYLYDSGWIIDIYTARGSLSCSSRTEADAKYRKQIESWLEKHEVKYHNLSFDKPLATYYIDDKSITPEQFLQKSFYQYKNGLSGASVFTDGKFVFKTADNTVNAIKWYEHIDSLEPDMFKTPMIHSVVGNTIKMEFIEGDDIYWSESHRNNEFKKLGQILDILMFFKNNEPIHSKCNSTDYLQRIEKHIELITDFDIKPSIGYISHYFNEYDLELSLNHGDFSVDNILVNENGIYLIDPLLEESVCQSYMIDSAKYLASMFLKSRNLNWAYIMTFCSVLDIDRDFLICLIVCELTRTIKYSNESRKHDIQMLFNEINCDTNFRFLTKE